MQLSSQRLFAVAVVVVLADIYQILIEMNVQILRNAQEVVYIQKMLQRLLIRIAY
jgi:hypothetical protein